MCVWTVASFVSTTLSGNCVDTWHVVCGSGAGSGGCGGVLVSSSNDDGVLASCT